VTVTVVYSVVYTLSK